MTAASAPAALTLTLRDDLAEIGRMAEVVEAYCDEAGLGPGMAHAFALSLDELLTNTISYGYEGAEARESDARESEARESEAARAGARRIAMRLAVEPGRVVAELRDDARPFDPTQDTAPNLDADLEARPMGGLGIHLVHAMMDEVAYERREGMNVVTLIKRMDPDPAGEG